MREDDFHITTPYMLDFFLSSSFVSYSGLHIGANPIHLDFPFSIASFPPEQRIKNLTEHPPSNVLSPLFFMEKGGSSSDDNCQDVLYPCSDWFVFAYFEGGNAMTYLGHKAIGVLLEAGSVQELDDAMISVNASYLVLRDQLRIMDEIRSKVV